jgi:bile acid-coenzyme A ligase
LSTSVSDPNTAGLVPPIGTQLARLAELGPDEPAITCTGETITRRELESSTNRLARAYRQRGVGVGDYVTIMLPNSIEWLQAAIATWKLGAVPQPLSARLPEAELEDLLRLVPRALLVGRARLDDTVPSVPMGFSPPADLSDGPLEEVVSPSLKAMASGGSTGRPKLIEATTDSRMSAFGGTALFGMREGETQLISSPLTHNTPFSMALLGLLLGQHVVLMPRFDAQEFLELIQKHCVNFLTTVPTILQRLLPVYRAAPGSYDLSSVRQLWHMAAPCPPAVKDAWIEILGPEKVWELYGGTEVQAITIIDGNQWLSHRGSVGKVATGQMKVLDEAGQECAPGTVGEIYMRPSQGAGPTYRYIGSEAKSRDGWDTIGDLGYFDEEGFLYLSDRRVDMFNVGGRKVYPAEVEGALAAHPDVLSCLVVGVPDEDLGQVPYAIVEVRPEAGIDAEMFRTFLRDRIAGYKIPLEIEFSATALRDDAGKARRSAVRASVIARLSSAKADSSSE